MTTVGATICFPRGDRRQMWPLEPGAAGSRANRSTSAHRAAAAAGPPATQHLLLQTRHLRLCHVSRRTGVAVVEDDDLVAVIDDTPVSAGRHVVIGSERPNAIRTSSVCTLDVDWASDAASGTRNATSTKEQVAAVILGLQQRSCRFDSSSVSRISSTRSRRTRSRSTGRAARSPNG